MIFFIQPFIVRSLVQNKLRILLSFVGIALGVSVFLAIQLTNQTALRYFQDSVETVSGKATLEIVPQTALRLNEQVLACLHPLWEKHIAFTPRLEETVIYPGKKSEILNLMGVDLLQDSMFRTQPENQMQAPTSAFSKNGVWASSKWAKAHHILPGDAFQVLLQDQKITLVLNDYLQETALSHAYGGNILYADIATVQAVTAHQGQISRIDLIVVDSQIQQTQEWLQKHLPLDVVVQRPKQRGKQVETMLSAFHSNLKALSVIAVLVGMFLIYNTMSISILRRQKEIATLRALGASKPFIFKLFASEVLLIAFCGSSLGVFLGLGFSVGSLHSVSSTVKTLYTGQDVTQLSIDIVTLVWVYLASMVLTCLAALPPLYEATQVKPALALRGEQANPPANTFGKQLHWLGIGLLLTALFFARQPSVNQQPVFGYAAAFLLFLGMACLIPVCLPVLFSALGYVLKVFFGFEAMIACAMLKGALNRSAVATASLMVGLAMMIGLAVMIGSFRDTVTIWVNQTLKADLFIEPLSRSESKKSGGLSPEWVAQLQRVPGIAAMDRFSDLPMVYQNKPCNLGINDMSVLAKYGHLKFTNQQTHQSVLNAMQIRPSALISESFAVKHGLKSHGVITLNTPQGPKQLDIAGVYFDYASDNGYIVVPRSWYTQYFPEPEIASVAVYLQPGMPIETVRNQIEAFSAGRYYVTIRTNQSLRQEVLRIFDQTFAITYALHIVAICVALLSIINTLLTLVIESKRSFYILKSLGMAQCGLQKVILIQAGVFGILGEMFGLITGFLLALLLIEVINKQSFGWTIVWSTPWVFLMQSLFLVLITAFLAGLIPARLLQKQLIAGHLRNE